MIRRSFPIAALAALLAILVSSCSAVPSTSPAVTPTSTPASSPTAVPLSGTLRLWMSPADTLDPIATRNSAYLQSVPLIYGSLFSLDDQNEPSPLLCADATATPDRLLWTLNLKAGVLFHDGTAFDAGDAAASANYWLSSGTGSLHDALVALDPVFEAQGDSKLLVRLSVPEKNLPWLLRFPRLPSESIGRKKSDPFEPIPGTGPFRILSYTKGEGLLLERVVASVSGVQRISIVECNDFQAALEAFQDDRIDMLPLDVDTYRLYRKREELRIIRFDSSSTVDPVFGTSPGRILSDPLRLSAVVDALNQGLSSDEVSLGLSVFDSGRGLPTGLASLLNGTGPTATPIPTPLPSPAVEWTTPLEILAPVGTFEADVATAISGLLSSAGIPSVVRPLPETDYMDAWMSGRYDIAIGSVVLPPVPGASFQESLAAASGTPYAEPLLRSEGLMLGPRVFGDPDPCIDDVYRGIEDTWEWSGS